MQAGDLPRRHQPQMAAFQRRVRDGGQKAIDLQPRLLLHARLQPGIEHGRDPVEHHAPEHALPLQRLKTLDQCRQRPGAATAICHQYRRSGGPPGQVPGTGPAGHGDAVIVAHSPLQNGGAVTSAVLPQRAAHCTLTHQKEVQIPGRDTQNGGVEHRVDVVRPGLERNRVHPTSGQSLKHGTDHGGLSAPAPRGGEEQTGDPHASPPVPLMSQTGF